MSHWNRFIAFSFALAVLSAPCAQGDGKRGGLVYAWRDEKGVMHYGNVLPPDALSRRQEVYDANMYHLGAIPRSLTDKERKIVSVNQHYLAKSKPVIRHLARSMALLRSDSEKKLRTNTENSIRDLEARIRWLNETVQKQRDLIMRDVEYVEATKKAGRPVPMWLNQDVAALRAQIRRYLTLRKTAKEKVNELKRTLRRKLDLLAHAKTIRLILQRPSILYRRRTTLFYCQREAGATCLRQAVEFLTSRKAHAIYVDENIAVLTKDGMSVLAIPVSGDQADQAVYFDFRCMKPSSCSMRQIEALLPDYSLSKEDS